YLSVRAPPRPRTERSCPGEEPRRRTVALGLQTREGVPAYAQNCDLDCGLDGSVLGRSRVGEARGLRPGGRCHLAGFEGPGVPLTSVAMSAAAQDVQEGPRCRAVGERIEGPV